MSMASDAGIFGSPGIVIMSPESTTMNPQGFEQTAARPRMLRV
jgi:hypothetical protein